MPEYELPNVRSVERLLVQTLIDMPDLFGQLSGLRPNQFTDTEAKKILLKMRKLSKAGREWLRSDFPILVDNVGTPIQPASHLQFPELVQRIRDTDFRRASYLMGMNVVTKAQRDDIEGLHKALDQLQTTEHMLNGNAPTSWAEQAAIIPEISWLWPDWLPTGLLSMIVGAPDIGKSALALVVARAVISGGNLPDGTMLEGGGRVVWFDTENAEAINHERAKLWGIPLDKILVPSINNDPLSDVNLLTSRGWDSFEAAVRSDDVRLALVDSLGGAYLKENDPHVKLLVQRLGALARDAQVAVCIVHHPRKLHLGEYDQLTLDRVRGHSGIVQFARVIWGLEKPDPATPDIVRCKVIKSNLGKKPLPFGFKISESGVRWTGAPEEPKEETQRDRAMDLLETTLKHGPVLATEVYEEAEGAGLGKNTIRRAQKAMHITSKKNGSDGRWYWSLPVHREIEPYIPEN